MDRDQTQAPAFWAEDLACSDEDIARGDIVPAHVVHDRLQTALAALEAELAAERDTFVTTSPRL
jgi:hypothetical protein